MPADCTDPTHNKPECTGHRKGGLPCHGPGLAGTDPPRCRMHAGGRDARTKATIRAAVARWTDGMSTLDPGETLLRLMTVAYLRAEQHADELNRIIADHGWTEAFVGDELVVTEDGRTRKVGEYAKQLAQWEATERRHSADLAVRAVGAGLEERRVRAEERQVTLFAEALDAALAELDLSDRIAEVKSGVARHLRAITG